MTAHDEEVQESTREFLRTHGPLSAQGLSELAKCSLPAAYQRIRSLERQGVALVTSSVRTGKRGPRRTLYSLPSEPGPTFKPIG